MGGREKLSEASKHVESAYQRILDAELSKATDRHSLVVDRMRQIEHSLADTASKQGKSLDNDVSILRDSCSSLESLVNEVIACTSELVQQLRDIDTMIPGPERLLTTGHPHRNHYGHLYALMLDGPLSPPQNSSVGSSQASLPTASFTSAKAESPSRGPATDVRQKLQDLALRR